ncbi:hypothetical protein STEG23_022027 [Scotinomys teguina]
MEAARPSEAVESASDFSDCSEISYSVHQGLQGRLTLSCPYTPQGDCECRFSTHVIWKKSKILCSTADPPNLYLSKKHLSECYLRRGNLCSEIPPSDCL